MSPARRPLTARPLDLLYFTFFLIHIPATLLVDIQAIYPPSLVPAPLARLPTLYLQMSGDPVIAGAFGLNGPPALWVWFKSFLILEAVFQLPVFVIGLRGLWRDSRTLYPLLLIYAASTATTTLPCLSTLLSTPLAAAPALLDPFGLSADKVHTPLAAGVFLTITSAQRTLLLASYVPFLLVPLLMCGDMAVRVAGLITRGLEVEQEGTKAEQRARGKGSASASSRDGKVKKEVK
ncbi:hypothetical protein DFH11DRAFT_1725267 [Phellopilus nigrolimitatus]|nr:hypothetical protein DFH11DRAFT_1725267 [Phellopilus nigrolimitatus]